METLHFRNEHLFLFLVVHFGLLLPVVVECFVPFLEFFVNCVAHADVEFQVLLGKLKQAMRTFLQADVCVERD